jgi:NAD(P)H-hydrate epimerase
LLIGCGLGFDGDVSRLVYNVVEEAACPLIIDADAINALSHNINILKKCKFVPILTPHIGEMARLTKLSLQEVLLRAPSLAQDSR